ncbi:hypothetical protein IMG5_167400 [Ichthyophthirius multifiliis]|uniref:Uncharacterized protein n=1 Tax=Ichthyophthirius multifiliis TaxID=5932 RepID=G0R0X5_ICHMU|nr:hypothetical protein IMG5_167400 [Ichthyophthirius multifiliis]EGR28886.1 hypothetical protein IMG5_167400 [Ichthyophthirius multifiliis]|eukprot:XP_004030122.1 hypothetical protein IMG5_167400 [Ichthyophthirius multifiliis]
MSLDQAVLRKEKVIILSEFRKQSDTLIKLKKEKKCPGYEDISDVDLTAESSQIYSLRRRLHHINQPYYFKADDQEIRCTYDHIFQHPREKWLVYAKFRRYVVGRANSLYLPFYIQHTFQNNDLNRGNDMQLKMQGIWVHCYNDIYPHKIIIDPENISKIRPLRIGDIQQLLPDGIELDKSKYLSIHQRVVVMSGDVEQRREMNMQSFMAQDETQEETQEFVDDQNVKLTSDTPKVKKERKTVKVKSLKKQVEAISAQVKEKLQTDFGAIKDEKKK